jgi:hypothetical protein
VKFRISIYVLFLTALATYVPATHAQTDGSPSSGGRSQWQAMRQEMMAACADKSAGTACSFSREGQAVTGTCRPMRQGQLVCHAGKGGGGRGMHSQMGGGMPGGGMPPDSAPEEWHAL